MATSPVAFNTDKIAANLLDSGARPAVLDSRGNTALHYLADNGLAEQWSSDAARALCSTFIRHGVDVNVRNGLGRTALEFFMDDPGTIHDRQWAQHFMNRRKPRPLDKLDLEILDMFDGAGARWAEPDVMGRTLLHVVGRHATPKAAFRAKYLLAKGVDPEKRDSKGRMAAEIGAQTGNNPVTVEAELSVTLSLFPNFQDERVPNDIAS